MAKNKSTTRTYEFRKLEDLNVIDNFLFHQMISDEEDGEEFARILLQTLVLCQEKVQIKRELFS